MNKTFVTGLLVVLAAGTAFAQESRPPRVGVIDMARVSAESALGKTYASQLEKLQNDINAAVTQKQSELAKMDASIKTLQDELEKQGAVLSAEARDKKQQEITRRARDRQAFFEDGQAEINRMRERAQQQAQTINNEFQLKVRPMVELVAKDKGLRPGARLAGRLHDQPRLRHHAARDQQGRRGGEAGRGRGPRRTRPRRPKPQAPKP